MNKRIPIIALFAGLMILGFQLQAQIDSLVMNTGEILIGEVKDLKQGVIIIETEYSDDDFRVEWDQVKYINTERRYIITMTNGDRFYGDLNRSAEQGKITINDEELGLVDVDLLDVVYMKSVDDKFLSRIDLLMSVGYSLTKANSNHQFSARLNAGYFSDKIGVSLYFSAVRSVQTPDSVSLTTERTEGGLEFQFFIYKDWFALVGADFLQSTEQRLDLRSVTRGGFGNYILNTNRMYFVVAAGGAWNYENYDNTPNEAGEVLDDRNSAEAFVGIEYNIFDIGDLDLKTNLVGYPSITESGRFRTDFSFDLKYEFPLDFFVNLGFTLNYDNQPVEGAESTDYVLQTTFGWEL